MGLFRSEKKSNFQDKPLVSPEDSLREVIGSIANVKSMITKLVHIKGDKNPQSLAYRLIDTAKDQLEKIDLSLSQRNVQEAAMDSGKIEENTSTPRHLGR